MQMSLQIMSPKECSLLIEKQKRVVSITKPRLSGSSNVSPLKNKLYNEKKLYVLYIVQR